jgi:hypothetical protein
MGFRKGIDRDQTNLFPVNLEDMIPKELRVSIIDLFIQKLDLQSLGFIASMPAAEGWPTYGIFQGFAGSTPALATNLFKNFRVACRKTGYSVLK